MHQWVISRAIPRAEARLSWWPGAPSPPAPRGRASWLEPPPAWLIPPTRREPAQAKGCGQKPNGSNSRHASNFAAKKRNQKSEAIHAARLGQYCCGRFSSRGGGRDGRFSSRFRFPLQNRRIFWNIELSTTYRRTDRRYRGYRRSDRRYRRYRRSDLVDIEDRFLQNLSVVCVCCCAGGKEKDEEG